MNSIAFSSSLLCVSIYRLISMYNSSDSNTSAHTRFAKPPETRRTSHYRALSRLLCTHTTFTAVLPMRTRSQRNQHTYSNDTSCFYVSQRQVLSYCRACVRVHNPVHNCARRSLNTVTRLIHQHTTLHTSYCI